MSKNSRKLDSELGWEMVMRAIKDMAFRQAEKIVSDIGYDKTMSAIRIMAILRVEKLIVSEPVYRALKRMILAKVKNPRKIPSKLRTRSEQILVDGVSIESMHA